MFKLRHALVALLLTVLTGSAADTPPIKIVHGETSFFVAGHSIHIDQYAPARNGPHPRVIMLHGAGGMIFDGPELRRVAAYLAEQGNSVDLVHYFNRTGTFFARDAVMQDHFEEWLGAVRAAIERGAAESGRPVVIYGYSLGAFLAIAAASDNPHVSAVIEHAGGVWNNKFERIHRMPPVLMIHGQQDQRVPMAKYAEPMAAALRERSPDVARRTFPAEGHVFTASAMAEVKPLAARFLRAHALR